MTAKAKPPPDGRPGGGGSRFTDERHGNLASPPGQGKTDGSADLREAIRHALVFAAIAGGWSGAIAAWLALRGWWP